MRWPSWQCQLGVNAERLLSVAVLQDHCKTVAQLPNGSSYTTLLVQSDVRGPCCTWTTSWYLRRSQNPRPGQEHQSSSASFYTSATGVARETAARC